MAEKNVTATTTILRRLEEANRTGMRRGEPRGEEEDTERESSKMSGCKDCLSSSSLAMVAPGSQLTQTEGYVSAFSFFFESNFYTMPH